MTKLTISIPQGILSMLEREANMLNSTRDLEKQLNAIGNMHKILAKYYSITNVFNRDELAKVLTQTETKDWLEVSLTQFAKKSILKCKLYPNISQEAIIDSADLISKVWSMRVVAKLESLKEFRHKKLLADRKCRLKRYITECPQCGSKKLKKDFKQFKVVCESCNWMRILNGSGLRLPIKPVKKQAKKTQ